MGTKTGGRHQRGTWEKAESQGVLMEEIKDWQWRTGTSDASLAAKFGVKPVELRRYLSGEASAPAHVVKRMRRVLA